MASEAELEAAMDAFMCEGDWLLSTAMGKALAAAEKVRGEHYTVEDAMVFAKKIDDAVTAAKAKGYRQGVEDAAKVAETYRCGCCGMDGQAAAAIRALTGEKPVADPT